MINSETGSAVQDNDLFVELVSVSTGMSLRYYMRGRARASPDIPVHIKIRIRVLRIGLAPTSTRIP